MICRLLPLVFVLGGCGNVDWRKVGIDEAQCLAPSVRGAVESAADTLVNAADEAIQQGHGPDSAEWQGALKNIAASFGVSGLICGAEHLVGDLFVADADNGAWNQKCHRSHKVRVAHLAYLKKITRR